jgi:hypothetical protein
MQDNTPQKSMSNNKKTFEPTPILKSHREPLLDDDTLQRLSRRSLFLYKVIMMQSVSTTYFLIVFSELFCYDGDAYVYVTDITSFLRMNDLISRFYRFSTCKNRNIIFLLEF